MAIAVFCEGCQKTYQVKDNLAGKRGKCPNGHALVIPAPKASFMSVPCSCGKRLRVPAHLEGKQIQCPACGVEIYATAASAAAAEAEEAAAPAWRGAPWLVVGGVAGVLLVGVVLFFLLRGNDDEPGPVAQTPIQEPVTPPQKEPLPEKKEPEKKDKPSQQRDKPSREEDPPVDKPPTPKVIEVVKKEKPASREWVLQTNLQGTEGWVHEVAYSPDGATLAATYGSGMVKLWDLTTGQERASMDAHKGHARALAFSPDGKILASGGDDKIIKLWDPATGMERLALPGHLREIQGLAFSPVGAMLASASADQTIKLWDPVAGKELATLKGHTQRVFAVAFSSDGKTLASGCEGNTLRFWDVQAQKERDAPLYHDFPVSSVAFQPGGQVVATGGGAFAKPGEIKLWNVITRGEVVSVRGHPGAGLVSGLAFSPDGKTLASSSVDQTVRLWDVATGKLKHTLKGGHTNALYCVAYSPDGKTLASAGADQTIKVWDLTNLSTPAADPAIARTDFEKAKADFEAALLKYDRKNFDAHGGKAWEKALALLAAAQKEADGQEHAAAAENYREALRLLPQAHRTAEFPRVQTWLFMAGYYGAAIAISKQGGTAAQQASLSGFAQAYKELGLPTTFPAQCRSGLFTWQEVYDHLDKDFAGLATTWGDQVPSTVTAGLTRSALHILLEIHERKPDPTKKDAVVNIATTAITTATKAGLPPEFTQTVEFVQNQLLMNFDAFTIQTCNKVLRAVKGNLTPTMVEQSLRAAAK